MVMTAMVVMVMVMVVVVVMGKATAEVATVTVTVMVAVAMTEMGTTVVVTNPALVRRVPVTASVVMMAWTSGASSTHRRP